MEQENIQIPKDWKKFARTSFLKRIIPCFVLLVVLAVALIIWGNSVFQTSNKAFQITCYVVVLLLPFVFTGVPFRLIDKTYCGQIERVDIKTTVDSASSVKPSRECLYEKNTIYLTVKTSNGKLVYQKTYEGVSGLQQHLATYQVGDVVFHLYGTKRTVVIPKEDDMQVQCVVCGTLNDKKDKTCGCCGHTLPQQRKHPETV